jgi:L-alanine-DL-glutamate epimerase-like enolase superfamily enzyme
LLSAPIPPGRRWTSVFGSNSKQDVAIVIVDTDDGLTGYGEATRTPVLMKVLAAATPNCVIFEFCQAHYPLLYNLVTTPVAVDADGYVSVPIEPGLGVELQPEDEPVRKYPFDAAARYAPARQAAQWTT